MTDIINAIAPEIWVAAITVFGGFLAKLWFDSRKSVRLQSELLEVTKAKAKRDREIGDLRFRREAAMDARSIAYDDYDQASKALVYSIGNHIVDGNDIDKIRDATQHMDDTFKTYNDAKAAYYKTAADINEEMLGKE